MNSAFTENYRFLARYNRWFNQRLYAACESLPDEERRRDRGAFFGSVHATLNHLVWGDAMWLQRFASQGVTFASLGGGVLDLPTGASYATVIEADWPAFKARRDRLDAAGFRYAFERFEGGHRLDDATLRRVAGSGA